MSPFFQRILPHVAAFIIFIALASSYFFPQLQGKALQSSDVVQYLGMSKEVKDFEKQTGEKSLWTNAMFGGMPTYQINTVHAGNNLKYIDRLLNLFGPGDGPIGRFFAAMLGFYILLVVLGVNPWLSIVGAIAFGLTPNSVVLLETGHISKVKSLIYFPYIVAGILLAYRQKYLWGGLLFSVGLGLNLLSNHPQMIYYLFITLLIFGVAQFIYSIRQNELKSFLLATATLLVGAILAFGSAASNLYVTMEYQKDTMRGGTILTSTENKQDQAADTGNPSKGLDWEYAMGWSNGMLDLAAAFIPGIVGGGTSEDASRYENTMKNQQWRAYVQQTGAMPPLYWGALPFTSGPIYFGAAMLLFFIMGLILVKGPVKWWLGLGVLLTFMLSLGKNLEWFNHPFFDFFPLYNKFRTPNSVLTVTSFLLPFLGFLGLNFLFNKEITSKKEVEKAFKIAFFISGGFYLFFTLLGPEILSLNAPVDEQLKQYNFDLSSLISDRKAYMRSDAFRSLLLTLAAAGLIWFYLKEKLKANLVILGLGAIVLFDLWGVGRRYLDYEAFVEQSRAVTLSPSPANEQILKDNDPNFRVFDTSDRNVFQSSRVSYFHKSLGGYHAAKLRRYADIIEYHLGKGNQNVYNMLNTKYFITEGSKVQLNPNAYGNAWFVKEVKMVNTPDEEIEALNNYGADSVAIVHKEFANYLGGAAQFNSNGTIKLTSYKPNNLLYESNSTADQLAVFSEIWYGPDKGWQAYIDGNPVDHIRVNYLLRALKIPAGQHKIEFKFDPVSYKTGTMISTVSSLIMLLGLIASAGYFGFQYYQKVKDLPPPTAPKSEKKKEVAPVARKKKPNKSSK